MILEWGLEELGGGRGDVRAVCDAGEEEGPVLDDDWVEVLASSNDDIYNPVVSRAPNPRERREETNP